MLFGIIRPIACQILLIKAGQYTVQQSQYNFSIYSIQAYNLFIFELFTFMFSLNEVLFKKGKMLPPPPFCVCICWIDGSHSHYHTQGLWVIGGLLSFLILEKVFPDEDSDPESKAASQRAKSSSTDLSSEVSVSPKTNGICSNNNSDSKPKTDISLYTKPEKIKTSGYLNLLANCIDNFTHGLAVAGSFLVSRKVGFLTTFAILLHEIPHEVGDFAILLRAGFDRWKAARMQLSTALGGVLGACFALCSQSQNGAENATAWILPFTSGSFLYIALVNVVPDLLQETNPRNSFLQILLLFCGIAVMALLSVVMD
uniref:Zinc transporter ZIP13 n=1 Tax=Sinocyclocheilus rhinocerous TaxID=307959 RepID=A0A673K009_9TELE